MPCKWDMEVPFPSLILHVTFRSNFRVPIDLKEKRLPQTGEESERRQQMGVVAKLLETPVTGKLKEDRFMMGIVYFHASYMD